MNSYKNKKLVIFGNGEQALLAAYMFTHDSNYEVAAFCVDDKYRITKRFQSLPLVAFENVEDYYPPQQYELFVAIGYSQLNELRALKYYEAKNKGYTLASYISSKLDIWPDFKCGDNCMIQEGNIIQPFVSIGNNVTMYVGNIIGHNSIIEDHVYISAHAVIAGYVTVGESSFIGLNSTIRDHIRIGKKNLIAAGALVIKDTDDRGVYHGSVAKKSKLNSTDINMI